MNILITGGSSGIGRQLAVDYAKAGHHVVVCARSEDALHALEQEYPGQIEGCRLDITDREDTLQKLGVYTDVDIAILNAGVCEYLDVEKFEAAMFERVFKVNVIGTMNCVQALLPNLNAGSRLVLVGSTARLLPFTRAQAYGGSKAALHYIARSLQLDLKKRHIKVLTVSPGFVETPMTDANDFEMPMKVTVDYASNAIRKGIENDTTDITFPTGFGLLLKFLSLLPQSWQVAISRKLA